MKRMLLGVGAALLVGCVLAAGSLMYRQTFPTPGLDCNVLKQDPTYLNYMIVDYPPQFHSDEGFPLPIRSESVGYMQCGATTYFWTGMLADTLFWSFIGSVMGIAVFRLAARR